MAKLKLDDVVIAEVDDYWAKSIKDAIIKAEKLPKACGRSSIEEGFKFPDGPYEGVLQVIKVGGDYELRAFAKCSISITLDFLQPCAQPVIWPLLKAMEWLRYTQSPPGVDRRSIAEEQQRDHPEWFAGK